jgi:hypothetical protein
VGREEVMQSENVGNLAKALAAAQAVMKAPKKGKTAKLGTYSYNYADLADVIESTREPLSKHGLSVAQPMFQRDGHIVLRTVLMHETGEWMDSEYPITSYAKPQEQGSAITYARRYALSALLGIAAEDDDDGAAAQDAKPAKKPEPAKAEPKATAGQLPFNGLSSEEVQSIHVAAKRAGYKTAAELAPVLMNGWGVSKASEIPRSELGSVLEALQNIEERQTA